MRVYRPSVVRSVRSAMSNAVTSATSVACSCLEWPKVTSRRLQLVATAIRQFGFRVLVVFALRAAD